jgi:hypothetical protein
VSRTLAAVLAAAGLLVAAAPRRADACAGCRNPNLPISRLATVHLAPGEVRASALLSATTLNVVHEAGCRSPTECHEPPVQPLHLHDQDIHPGELRAILEAGLTAVWGLEAHLPLRITHTRIHYETPAGAPYQPVDAGVHHRDETLVGPGDPWLLARAAKNTGGFLLTARAGLSFPLGRTEENPFALGARGLRHQHIQFGTGTFDPVAAVDVSRTVSGVELSGYGQAQLTLYENEHGYRAGSRWSAGLQVGRRLTGSLVPAVGLDLLHEGAERWDGQIQQDGNLGRTELLGGLSLSYAAGPTLLSLWARVPLARWIVTGEGQAPGRLSSPLMVSLSATWAFGRRG